MEYPLILPPLEAFQYRTPVQLRFNDIDILGHLNNTVYISLYDLAKAKYFEALKGATIATDWRRVDTVIANVDCAYLKQVRFHDHVEVWTRCIELREKSLTLEQAFISDSGEYHSLCRTVMVAFDPETGKAKPIDHTFAEALRKDMERGKEIEKSQALKQ